MSANNEASVAIIGAGASGLAAAAALNNAGVKNVVVLEASNRIGGRINRYFMSSGKDGHNFQTSNINLSVSNLARSMWRKGPNGYMGWREMLHTRLLMKWV